MKLQTSGQRAFRLLKTENRANAYDEIYLTYKRMYDRQALRTYCYPAKYRHWH